MGFLIFQSLQKMSHEKSWKLEIRQRISRLPKSAPFCQKTQHWDTRPETSTRVTAFIVNNKEDYVILVQELSGKYNLPGGRVKVDEANERGLFREICEEVGLELKEIDIAQFEEYEHDVYLIKLFEPDIDKILVSPGAEILEIVWFPLNDLLEDLNNKEEEFTKSIQRLYKPIKQIIDDISKHQSSEDLTIAVRNNDLDYIIANLKYYPKYQIEEVIPLAVQYDALDTLRFLMSYGNYSITTLLDIAIKNNYKDIVEYLIDNYRSREILNVALMAAIYFNNFDLVKYFIDQGAVNIEENINKKSTTSEMRKFLQNYIRK